MYSDIRFAFPRAEDDIWRSESCTACIPEGEIITVQHSSTSIDYMGKHLHKNKIILMGNQPTRLGPFTNRLLHCWIPSEVCGIE